MVGSNKHVPQALYSPHWWNSHTRCRIVFGAWDATYILCMEICVNRDVLPKCTDIFLACLCPVCIIALCSYPHVKVSIRDLNQIFYHGPHFPAVSLFQTKYLDGYLGSIYISGRFAIIIPSYNLRSMRAMVSLGTS